MTAPGHSFSIAIIGTAGRDRNPHLSLDLYRRMYADAHDHVARIAGEWATAPGLVSGGAAWSDHLACSLFLCEAVSQLTLYLPAPLGARGFEERGFRSPGSVANYYHRRFTRAVRHDSIRDLNEAAERGADLIVVPGGFHARNRRVAAEADFMLAYTWGSGDEPADGGTAHTWKASTLPPERRIHVCLADLLDDSSARS